MKLLFTLFVTVCSLVAAAAQSMTPMKDALALSPEQHVKSEQIRKESSIEMRGIYKLKATNPTKYLKERERIVSATDAKYKLILTKDQYSAYAEMRKEQNTRFGAGVKPTAHKKKIVIQ